MNGAVFTIPFHQSQYVPQVVGGLPPIAPLYPNMIIMAIGGLWGVYPPPPVSTLKAVDLEFLKFLSEIDLTEESFSKQGFEEFRRWYGTFPPQEYAAYGEISHAYSQILKPLYTPGALKAAKQAFGRLLEGHPGRLLALRAA